MDYMGLYTTWLGSPSFNYFNCALIDIALNEKITNYSRKSTDWKLSMEGFIWRDTLVLYIWPTNGVQTGYTKFVLLSDFVGTKQ